MIELKVGEKSLAGLAHASVKEYLQSPEPLSPVAKYRISEQKNNKTLPTYA